MTNRPYAQGYLGPQGKGIGAVVAILITVCLALAWPVARQA